MNYFNASRVLSENWLTLVNSGKFDKDHLAHFQSIIQNPAMYQRTEECLLDYADELHAGNQLTDQFVRYLNGADPRIGE